MVVMLVLNSSENGVTKERGFQASCAKVCFLVFLLRFYSYSLSTLAV
jgi:hypothetical protein